MIHPRDVGHVAARQPARVKLDAFPFQKHGTIAGHVRTVSRDAFPSDAEGRNAGPGQPTALFYRAASASTTPPARPAPGRRPDPRMAVQARSGRPEAGDCVFPVTR